jgi:hypothetical protein
MYNKSLMVVFRKKIKDMHEEPKEKYSFVQEDTSKIDMPTGHLSSFSVFFDKVHSVNGLHLLSALFQIILGSSVVALSVLDMVQPVLLAALMSVIGSTAIVTGIYFTYYVFSRSNSFDSLINRAIKRVINNQN